MEYSMKKLVLVPMERKNEKTIRKRKICFRFIEKNFSQFYDISDDFGISGHTLRDFFIS